MRLQRPFGKHVRERFARAREVRRRCHDDQRPRRETGEVAQRGEEGIADGVARLVLDEDASGIDAVAEERGAHQLRFGRSTLIAAQSVTAGHDHAGVGSRAREQRRGSNPRPCRRARAAAEHHDDRGRIGEVHNDARPAPSAKTPGTATGRRPCGPRSPASASAPAWQLMSREPYAQTYAATSPSAITSYGERRLITATGTIAPSAFTRAACSGYFATSYVATTATS